MEAWAPAEKGHLDKKNVWGERKNDAHFRVYPVNSLALDTNGYGEQNIRRLVHASVLEMDLRVGGE